MKGAESEQAAINAYVDADKFQFSHAKRVYMQSDCIYGGALSTSQIPLEISCMSRINTMVFAFLLAALLTGAADYLSLIHI